MTATTKIASGLYQFAYKGRVFQVEDIRQASDGECAAGWFAFELINGRREYLNDYLSKRAAVARTIDAVDAGF